MVGNTPPFEGEGTPPFVCVAGMMGVEDVAVPRATWQGTCGHAWPRAAPIPSLRVEDISVPFSPPRGVTHPSSCRFPGPQRGGSGCRGRRQQPCPAGRTQTVRGPEGAPHRTSTPHHPAHHGWPGLGLAQSSDQSHPWSPGSGLLAAEPRTGARRSAGGNDTGSSPVWASHGWSHAAHKQTCGKHTDTHITAPPPSPV